MRKALPQMLDLSRVLLAHEARATESPTVGVTAADVCEELHPTLSTLMGATGFRALLARALALAAAEVPSLCQLEVDAAGRLVGPEPMEFEGSVVLVAQLLSLLAAFIGEQLTRQLLLERWPRLPAHDSNSKTGDSE
jgi:hypothetical protein